MVYSNKVGDEMSFSYKPWWKMLIDLEMSKKECADAVDISMSTIKRMAKNEYVSLKIIDEICDKLECTPDDVMDYIPNNKENK